MSADESQQPVARVVGRRLQPEGEPPDAAARAAMTAMAQYRTRAPKGIFYYDSHEQMTADRQRWTVAAVVNRALQR
jgi:hypothetical protein